MTETEILKILDLPEIIDNAVRMTLSKRRIKTISGSAYEGEAPDFPICKRMPLTRLAVIITLLCKKYDDYFALGVPEKIIKDTFRDISLRARLYYRKTGKPGISKDDAIWFRHIMNIGIFKVESLLFQPFEMIYLDEEFLGEEYMSFDSKQKQKLPPGAHVINCHIQSGTDLSIEKAAASFAGAQSLFERIYPNKKFKAFVCYSWLLYPNMLELLSDGSKIRSFAKNFEIIGMVQDSEQAFENLFGKAYIIPPNLESSTSLQHLAAKKPNAFGFACGVKYI